MTKVKVFVYGRRQRQRRHRRRRRRRGYDNSSPDFRHGELKIEESFGIRMLFPKISAENVHSWSPYKQFLPKNLDSAMKPSSNYAIFIVYPYA